MKHRQGRRVVVALSLVFAISPHALAGITDAELGVQAPSVAGESGAKFNTTAGWSAAIGLDSPSFGPQSGLVGSVRYQPLKIKNMTDAARLHLVGFHGGIKTWGKGAILGMSPYLSVGIGFTYALLSFTGVSNTQQNANTYFSMEVVPGVEFPLFEAVSGSVSLPLHAIFARPSALSIWSQTFSLRYHL